MRCSDTAVRPPLQSIVPVAGPQLLTVIHSRSEKLTVTFVREIAVRIPCAGTGYIACPQPRPRLRRSFRAVVSPPLPNDWTPLHGVALVRSFTHGIHA
jgi:hypothetical protein